MNQRKDWNVLKQYIIHSDNKKLYLSVDFDFMNIGFHL